LLLNEFSSNPECPKISDGWSFVPDPPLQELTALDSLARFREKEKGTRKRRRGKEEGKGRERKDRGKEEGRDGGNLLQ